MATLNFALKKRFKRNDYYIYIRISHSNESAKYLSLHLKVKEGEWDKKKQRFKRIKANHAVLNSTLNDIEIRAENIISELIIDDKFSFEAFKKEYQGFGKKSQQTVKEFFTAKVEQLENSKRYGSLRTYKNCFSSLSKFASLDIPFSNVDYKFLMDFELFHINLGNKPNSYGGYFRILRALHYEYCKMNNLSEPIIYKQFNLARLKNETRKKSLTKEQLKKLIDFIPPSEAQNHAKQLLLFSFYARGINLMDILQLTDKSIEGDVLVYRRQKTGKQMRIKLVKEAKLILQYFKNDSDYLFPYLEKDQIPKYRVRDVNSNINRRLKLIGKTFGVEGLTMYFARHTFAELNYKAGVRIEIISQMLGHSDLKTTQTYLRSFSDGEVDEAATRIFDSL